MHACVEKERETWVGAGILNLKYAKFDDNWFEQSGVCGQPFVLSINLTTKHQNKIKQSLTSVLLIGLLERSVLMASTVLLVAGSATH